MQQQLFCHRGSCCLCFAVPFVMAQDRKEKFQDFAANLDRISSQLSCSTNVAEVLRFCHAWVQVAEALQTDATGFAALWAVGGSPVCLYLPRG